METVKWVIDLFWYYKKDKARGTPYWQDPAFIGLVVSILATELLKFAGLNINSDLQLKIVGVITGLGVAVSPQTGVHQDPAEKAKHAAMQLQEENRKIDAGLVAPPSTAAAKTDRDLPNIM